MKTLIKLASQRASVPILKTVLVQNGIATATDQETYISAPCDAPAGLYNGAGFDMGMNTLSKEFKEYDFPINNADKGTSRHIQMFNLATLLDDMMFVSKAMSKEVTRYYLCGIVLHNNNMVATDGHRLHMVTYEGAGFTKNINNYESSFIIPSNSVKLLLALMKENKKSVNEAKMTLYKRHAVFEVGNTTLQTEYIDGTYPRYERVIPDYSEDNKTVFVQKEAKEALKQAKVLAKITGNSIKSIAINDTGAAKIMSNSEYAKDFDISIRLEHKTGFNLQYLADMTDGDLYYGGVMNPVKIVNANRTGVIMPLKI